MDSSDSSGLLSDSRCFSWNDVHKQIQKKEDVRVSNYGLGFYLP